MLMREACFESKAAQTSILWVGWYFRKPASGTDPMGLENLTARILAHFATGHGWACVLRKTIWHGLLKVGIR